MPRCRFLIPFSPARGKRPIINWGLEADRREAAFIFDVDVGTAIKLYLAIMIESRLKFQEV